MPPKTVNFLSARIFKRLAVLAVIFVLSTAPFSLPAQNRADEMVMYNVKTHKVHKPDCVWAIRCTKNCIPLKRSEAYKRGGVACKVCGG